MANYIKDTQALMKTNKRAYELNEKSKTSTLSQEEEAELSQLFLDYSFKMHSEELNSLLKCASKSVSIFTFDTKNCIACKSKLAILKAAYQPYNIKLDIVNPLELKKYINDKNLEDWDLDSAAEQYSNLKNVEAISRSGRFAIFLHAHIYDKVFVLGNTIDVDNQYSMQIELIQVLKLLHNLKLL